MLFTCSVTTDEPGYFSKTRLVRSASPSGTFLSSSAVLNNPQWNVCKSLLIKHQTGGFFSFKSPTNVIFFFYSRAEKRDVLNVVLLKNKQINGKVVSLGGVCAQTGIKISSPGRSVGILIIFLEFSLSPISDFPGSDLVLTEVISSMTKQPAEASLTFTTKFLCLHNPTWACLKHSNRIQGQ